MKTLVEKKNWQWKGWADGKGFMDILSHSNSTRYHLREFAP